MPDIVTKWVTLRKAVGRGLLFLQSRSIYRAVGRHALQKVNVVEASPRELAYIYSKLNPGAPYPPSPPNPAATELVAERKGHVLGFVELVRHSPSHAPYIGHWLFSLYLLHPVYRGLGIGEMLTQAVLDIAWREEAREFFLVVNETILPVIRLYEKMGFQPILLPVLEEILEDEARIRGMRRIAMVKPLHD